MPFLDSFAIKNKGKNSFISPSSFAISYNAVCACMSSPPRFSSRFGGKSWTCLISEYKNPMPFLLLFAVR
jgi:hypothetical protein